MNGTVASGADARRLAEIASEAAHCDRCDLYRRATQTVFGEGPVPAVIMLVGEQPGDREDRQGAPFVGPAGRVLEEALEAAEIDRGAVYITNAVKHFKWEARGKRRIHKRPNATEIEACSMWLAEEVAHVHPTVVVAMGATAVRAVLGKTRAVAPLRGQVLESMFGPPMVVTVHPSAIVRVPDRDDRQAALQGMVDDLRLALQVTETSGPRRRRGE
ncbi:MAG TPA: UdgX family uracil-DNA binding protein [Acidimicrobiales bacterium]|jgi:uracil-DNA glycosylase family protein|nr:UdgX family uracil-DNA binding protein [Acidimicrobiales bacterium]